MNRWQKGVLALALALLAGFGGTSIVAAQGQSVTLQLGSQNNSGVTGTATLTEIGGGKLRVEIRANGAGPGPQPAHIHDGNCAQLDPAPKFALANVVNGMSTTEVDGSLADLTSSPHAIHMHKSPDELPVYLACADIKLASQPGTLPGAGEAPPATGWVGGVAGAGLLLIAMGHQIWRRART